MEKAFAYICAAQEAAPRLLRRYCHKVYELGYVPICPKLSLPQYLSAEVPEEQRAMSRMPREEYLRALVMGGEVRARPCTHHADLLRKVSGLCNNANQLAHVANSTGFAGRQSVDEMTRIAREVWRAVKEQW